MPVIPNECEGFEEISPDGRMTRFPNSAPLRLSGKISESENLRISETNRRHRRRS